MSAPTTKFFIDCEWNSFGGELISMALVPAEGYREVEFYVELERTEPDHPWVAEHVIPHLNPDERTRHSFERFQRGLKGYLSAVKGPIEIIADWPDDLTWFIKGISAGPGEVTVYRPIILNCQMGMFKGAQSVKPHHALSDAFANRAWAEKIGMVRPSR